MDRRKFLGTLSAAAGCAVSAVQNLSVVSADVVDRIRIVDTHTHFYDPSRKEGVPWPAKGSSLYRTVLPKDWLAVAVPHGVTETVVVEASGWLEDNQWILDLAKENKSIVGFVGHLNPEDADFPAQVKRFAANPIFRGIRIGGNVARYRDMPDFQRGIKLLADMGLELDINGPPAIHEATAQMAQAVPDLRIVVNHVGSAGDAAMLSKEWHSGMAALGRQPNVFCKVSALTEQSAQSGRQYGSSPRDVSWYEPILDHCWECFGENRLIYGSNWPVCEKGGSYSDQFVIVSQYFAGRGRAAVEKYFRGNALAAYRWPDA